MHMGISPQARASLSAALVATEVAKDRVRAALEANDAGEVAKARAVELAAQQALSLLARKHLRKDLTQDADLGAIVRRATVVESVSRRMRAPADPCREMEEYGPHRLHPDIVASPLGRLPDMIRDTLKAADYHRALLSEAGNAYLLQEGQGTRSVWFQEDRQKTRWHLRSFFWDLVAAFDLVLVWCNEQFELGIHPRAVSWRCVKDAVSRTQPDEWTRVLATLSRFEADAAFFEIRAYRNYAHRDFLFGNVLVSPTGEMIGLTIPYARVGQAFETLETQLRRYAEFMSGSLAAVLEPSGA